MRFRTSQAAVLAVTVALAGATAVSGASAAVAGAHAEPMPTVVLVHGAFADAASGTGVIERLQRRGYPVVAAANPLRGLSSDAGYLRTVINSISGPIVLAGHSYGGAVMTDAAAGDPDVTALVYIAAFAPDRGESALELSNTFPGSTLGATLDPVETVEIRKASHAVGVSHPEPVADLIVRAATAR
ncbi:alpha/beta hydrolase [Actinoplanes sp. CA-015351]|uniref:alpha/beta hydrolase n=1 Tax=Actinoplanes sp. CA-015351 TaxID=3239897 RepID=UPI003D980B30